MKSRHHFLWPILLATVILIGLLTPLLVLGQGDTIVTVAVSDWMTDVFNDGLFAEFEAQHPGVKVLAVPAGDKLWYPTPVNIEEHLDGALAYSQTADVLYVQDYNLTPEATWGGAFLDLTPLVTGDRTLNETDFFPSVWKSYQWDNKIWALPVAASPIVLLYDAAQFDEAGLAYPTGDWSLEDLLTTAAALAEYDANGDVVRPGLIPGSAEILLRAIYGRGLYDPTTLPNQPVFDDPELVSLLERYAAMEASGEAGGGGGDYAYDEVPMIISQPFQLYNPISDGHDWHGALLPYHSAGLAVDAFAISRGSTQPELAYELAKYLTYSPDVVLALYNTHPARQSMVGVEPDEEPSFNILNFLDEEDIVFLNEAMQQAFPISETRYINYLVTALNQIQAEDVDVQSALFAAEELAHENLTVAQARSADAVVIVATPVPTPVLAAGEVAIRFGLFSAITPLPNQEEWNAQIADFVARDPQVGHVELITNMSGDSITDQVDCLFIGSNLADETMTDAILDLTPLIAADPNFDSADVLPGTMEQLRRNNYTWGLPVILQPAVLLYDEKAFANAGVVTPDRGWTVDAFAEAMRNVAYVSESDDPVFVPLNYNNTYLLLLMAAYGGLPVDYRTSPPTVNLTDPVMVDAIRQTLDLAKEGLIDYQELDTVLMSGGGWNDLSPIFSDILGPYGMADYLLENNEVAAADPNDPQYRLTTFPRGNQYAPLAHDVSAAYISAATQHPEACYRWISELSRRPDLFSGMPTTYSLLNDPVISAAYAPDTIDFYRRYAEILRQPDALTLPNLSGGSIESIEATFEGNWLNGAFDAYVLEDADLEVELAAADQNITAFRECAASLPPRSDVGDTQEEQIAYINLYLDCVRRIDLDLAAQYDWINDL